jgi:hypothetical protein
MFKEFLDQEKKEKIRCNFFIEVVVVFCSKKKKTWLLLFDLLKLAITGPN